MLPCVLVRLVYDLGAGAELVGGGSLKSLSLLEVGRRLQAEGQDVSRCLDVQNNYAELTRRDESGRGSGILAAVFPTNDGYNFVIPGGK